MGKNADFACFQPFVTSHISKPKHEFLMKIAFSNFVFLISSIVKRFLFFERQIERTKFLKIFWEKSKSWVAGNIEKMALHLPPLPAPSPGVYYTYRWMLWKDLWQDATQPLTNRYSPAHFYCDWFGKHKYGFPKVECLGVLKSHMTWQLTIHVEPLAVTKDKTTFWVD